MMLSLTGFSKKSGSFTSCHFFESAIEQEEPESHDPHPPPLPPLFFLLSVQ